MEKYSFGLYWNKINNQIIQNGDEVILCDELNSNPFGRYDHFKIIKRYNHDTLLLYYDYRKAERVLVAINQTPIWYYKVEKIIKKQTIWQQIKTIIFRESEAK